MQLNVTTDYAIRTVLFIASEGGVVSSAEISSAMKIPQNYVLTLTKRLRDAGIIEATRGTDGGYSLAKVSESISVYDIINVMENTTRLNRCLEEDCYCSRSAAPDCPMRKSYEKLQSIFDDTLAAISIKSLMG